MPRSFIALLIAACIVSSAPALADTPEDPLIGLAWMAGHWVGGDDSTRLEEMWLEPVGGTMLGANRTIKDGRTTMFEFLRLAAGEDGITYWASPGGRCPPTGFRLVESVDHRAVFANEEHDFPQRIVYWREGSTLHARIEGEVEGEARQAEWSWRLQAPAR